jgi:hypothetical protein
MYKCNLSLLLRLRNQVLMLQIKLDLEQNIQCIQHIVLRKTAS